jgi:hypothetical protein
MLGFLLGALYVEHKAQKLIDNNGIGDKSKAKPIYKNSDTSHIFKKRSAEELIKLAEKKK